MRNKLPYFFLLIMLSACSFGDMIINWVPLSFDKQMGEQSRFSFEHQWSGNLILSENKYSEAYEIINHIRDQILQSGQMKHAEDFTWDIKIVDDTSVINAFCMPGGHIYIFTGLIQFLDATDELAGVLGHEMAHADMRHGTRQIVENSSISLISGLIFGFDAGGMVGLAQNLLQLKFSRNDEQEADKCSVRYLYQTDYDARGVKHFFEKMQKTNNNQVSEFISTHPADENRSHKIDKEFKRLGAKPGKHFEKEYRHLKSLLNLR